MTLYYDSEKKALVENHGDTYAELKKSEGAGAENGLVFDVSDTRKLDSLVDAVLEAARDNEVDVSDNIQYHREQLVDENPEDWGWRKCVQQAISYLDSDEPAASEFALEYVEDAESMMSHDKEVGAKDLVQRGKSAIEGDETDAQAANWLHQALEEGGVSS